ncbi:hypothetical protein [Gracilibacillus xinjiangensis]|uniref:ABC-2 type transport system permease protein n=1 Tax=Gracilibacillus xinjiangensis TaxID=1193282 RepID=A0ABV8WZG8_9BACI
MQSKTFYFKKEILKQSFRTTGWIGIAYFLALTFILPMQIIMELSRDREEYGYNYLDNIEKLIDINTPLQLITILIVPIAAGIFAFRYMQVKGSADFIHSLPLTRNRLFQHHFFMGYAMVIMPIAVTGIILYVMSNSMNLIQIYNNEDILEWIWFTLIITSLMYTFTVLIGGITGISAVQGMLSYILLIFPVGIVFLIFYNLEMLLEGFSAGYLWEENVTSLSPIVHTVFTMTEPNEFNSLTIWIYAILTVICYVAALILYRIRPVESATQTLLFYFLKPIFKFGVTFCFMLLFGTYFGLVQQQHIGWVTFGYLFGALIGYILAEMLIQKTWRVFGEWKGFVVYIGFSLLVLASLVFDWFGYESRVPDAEKVASIQILDNLSYDSSQSTDMEELPKIEDPELIKLITQFHQEIIDNGVSRTNRDWNEDSRDLYFDYYLENGNHIKRSYFISSVKKYEEYLKPIFENVAFKKSNMAWLFNENIKVNKMSIYSRYKNGNIDVNSGLKSEILDALREDYLEATYEEIIHTEDSMIDIEIQLDANGYGYQYLNIPRSYTNTLELFQNEGFGDLISLTEQEVVMIAIKNEESSFEYLGEVPYSEESDLEDVFITEDQMEIEQLVKLEENYDYEGNWTIAAFGPTRDNYITSFSIKEDQLPEFVLQTN